MSLGSLVIPERAGTFPGASQAPQPHRRSDQRDDGGVADDDLLSRARPKKNIGRDAEKSRNESQSRSPKPQPGTQVVKGQTDRRLTVRLKLRRNGGGFKIESEARGQKTPWIKVFQLNRITVISVTFSELESVRLKSQRLRYLHWARDTLMVLLQAVNRWSFLTSTTFSSIDQCQAASLELRTNKK